MNRTARHALGWGLIIMSAVGCAGAPPLRTLELDTELPESWSADTTTTWPRIDWWLDFDSPDLDALLGEAFERNHNLRAAAARVDRSLAQAKIAGADLYPQLSATGSASRRKQNFIGLPIPGSENGILSTYSTSYSAGLLLGWELDLWGRVRNERSAAGAEAEASLADFSGARLSLAGQVSRAWFAAAEAKLQRDLAETTVESYQETARQVQDRFRTGLRSSLDLRLAESNLASARATLEARERLLDGARRRLEVLLGRYPGARIDLPADLPDLEAPPPGGLPAELVSRRPDLIAAERRLASADARIASARAALYPRLSLTASGGTASQDLEDLLDDSFSVWSLLGNLTAPLFQGGRLRGQVAATRAAAEEAAETFASALLSALSEVESALAAESFLSREDDHLSRAVEEAMAAESVAQEQYKGGLVDFVTVLESQRASLSAQSRYLQVRRARLDQRVNLHIALGGGFHLSRPSSPDLDRAKDHVHE